MVWINLLGPDGRCMCRQLTSRGVLPGSWELAGLVLNALLGWWWADPIAALAIAAVAVREG
ncbi:hypothetical protein [Nonomuraea africana]|uniref:hypothetical protein n=1 Tax=Nonomuraea africana TaxID=46171 RepID=UPI00379EEEF0